MPQFSPPGLDTTNLIIELPDGFDPDCEWDEDLECDHIAFKYVTGPYALLEDYVGAIACDYGYNAFCAVVYTTGDECEPPVSGAITDVNFMACLAKFVDFLNKRPDLVVNTMLAGTAEYEIGDTMPGRGLVTDVNYIHGEGYSYRVGGEWHTHP